MLLGETLIKKNMITPAQLKEALEEQKKTRQFLGSILVRKKFIEIKDLVKVLSDTGRPVLLGELMLDKGLLTETQLDMALEEQRLSREFLGIILVRRRYISEKDF